MIDPLVWVILALLLADFGVVVVRASLANARLPYLLNLREQHPQAVDRASAVIERPRLRLSFRLASFLLHFSLAGCIWLALQHWFGGRLSEGGAIALVLAGGLCVLLFETAFEGWALRAPEEMSLRLAFAGQLIDVFFTPLSSLLQWIMRAPATSYNPNRMTDDELKNWVEEGQPEGSLQEEERKMIYSIFHFRETLVREIMIPRIDVQALELTNTLGEASEAMRRTGHSRMPIFEGTIDNIIGLLYAKDLLPVRGQDDKELGALRELLRPAYFVPEAKQVDELLTELQERRVHMAVVVDEYGGVAGLVTLEDIVEEIVGEIQDEYDQAEEMLYQTISPDEVVFQGRIGLDDFNEVMDSHLATENSDTLAGFIYSEMGRIPAGGEKIQVDGLEMTVELVTARRIRKVRARRIHTEAQADTE